MDVVLVDGGGTNIGSVRYALQRLGVDARMTADADRIAAASHVILPGVGAAGPGMAKLREAGLTDALRDLRQPLLGVCLGMQLLYEHSEEGDTECLGLLPGAVTHFPPSGKLRIPHMGWNSLRVERDDPLLAGVGDEPYAYFVHSYAAPVTAATIASTDHGARFSAVVRRGNVCGMQFHPERSAAVGAQLLRNFLDL
ncbi:MAG TPA: imidazole glycerol phosphate synthase subunit HisH [Rudaea sp.]|nr:imidazole glycerol phosphate synthase subunit HisH [Rudaea sp.]